VGLWSFLTGAPVAPFSSAPAMLASPLASSDSLEAAIIGDFFGELPAEVITLEVASRVPEVKKALVAHQSLVSPLKFEKFIGGQRAEFQPYWVSQCAYRGTSRLIALKMLVAELFWHGQAVLGCRLDTEGNVYDWVTIPRKLWNLNAETGWFDIDPTVPAEYRMRAVYVPLGENGVLTDGIDSIRQARKLELARQGRLDSPPAATELHITDSSRDEMTSKEKARLARDYSEGRRKHSVSVTPSYLDVKERGISGALDLFESAKNSLRLELAMHGGVPASYVEGGKEGGAGGQMTYQNENGVPSEVWTFGSSRFAYAIAAALSGDDVVGANAEVRIDASAFAVPAPLAFDPEAGDVGAIPASDSIPTEETT
jgi:hypothetical protein